MNPSVPERGKRYRNTTTGETGECLRCVSPLEEYSYYVMPDGAGRTRENVAIWSESEMTPVNRQEGVAQ